MRSNQQSAAPLAPPARNPSDAQPTAPRAELATFRHLYRAHIEPRDSRLPERTAYVEADSHRAAIQKIAAAVAALEGRTVEQLLERIYNCTSARECIDEGESEDDELRVFEVGWGAAIVFVSEPLFLVERPRT